MKNLKITTFWGLIMIASILPAKITQAQLAIPEVINLTVGKAIRALDLKVQRMQNKTIWLQNAQKIIENQLANAKLTEISGWSDQQKQLYSNYYGELWKIKSVISGYQRIKDATLRQAAVLSEYHRTWNLLRQDTHFSSQELAYMQRVYAGILAASVNNIGDVMLAVSGNTTQMSDEQRLELVRRASDQIDENYNDLRQFNNQGMQLSLSRSNDLKETQTIKKYYGIN